jgi:hypothetical protein
VNTVAASGNSSDALRGATIQIIRVSSTVTSDENSERLSRQSECGAPPSR